MNIKVESEGKKATVYVSGRIDIPGAERLKQTFDQIAAKNPAEVIIDFGEVSFIESSGIEKLRLFNQAITSRGGSVQIVNSNKEIRDKVETSGLARLDKLFNI